MGGRWHNRAGRIIADGTGTGFGGRTMLSADTRSAKAPYESSASP